MKIVKRLLFLTLIANCFACSNLPGTAGSRYSLEGYNNSGYSGDYQRQGGFDDASLQEARMEREKAAREKNFREEETRRLETGR